MFRKGLLALLLLTGAGFATNMFTVEDNTFFESGVKDTVKSGEEIIAEVTLNLNQEAYCTIITAGGILDENPHYLIVDQDTVLISVSRCLDDLTIIRALDIGEHTIQLAAFQGTILIDFVRLQVLVRYPSILR